MKASDLLGPAFQALLDQGKSTTKQISKDTGIPEHRLSQLRDHPEAAKICEVEALTTTYHYAVVISGHRSSDAKMITIPMSEYKQLIKDQVTAEILGGHHGH